MGTRAQTRDVSKDLHDLFGARPRPLEPHLLRWRLEVQTLYGHGDCAGDPDPQCYDQNRSVITSAISVPPAPFQNRPTFQQTVSVTRNLP